MTGVEDVRFQDATPALGANTGLELAGKPLKYVLGPECPVSHELTFRPLSLAVLKPTSTMFFLNTGSPSNGTSAPQCPCHALPLLDRTTHHMPIQVGRSAALGFDVHFCLVKVYRGSIRYCEPDHRRAASAGIFSRWHPKVLFPVLEANDILRRNGFHGTSTAQEVPIPSEVQGDIWDGIVGRLCGGLGIQHDGDWFLYGTSSIEQGDVRGAWATIKALWEEHVDMAYVQRPCFKTATVASIEGTEVMAERVASKESLHYSAT